MLKSENNYQKRTTTNKNIAKKTIKLTTLHKNKIAT